MSNVCDLLGMSFNTPVSARVSLDLFQRSGIDNPDGWGLAFYREGRVQIIKEAEPADDSVLFDFMERYHRSQTIISHVRRSTRGGRSYPNTHPFYRSLTRGSIRREYAFAHNGTLVNQQMLSLGEFLPIGDTDSERAFCHILGEIAQRSAEEWSGDEYRFVADLLSDINHDENTLNCIFSDGIRLFCYSDRNDHNNGLRFMKQTSPYKSVELVGHGNQLGRIDITGESEETGQSGYIVSTRILTQGTWTEFEGGEMMVFEHGMIVYPSSRATV